MSFDEQPDGDIHGECAAEIRRLEQWQNEASALLATFIGLSSRPDELEMATNHHTRSEPPTPDLRSGTPDRRCYDFLWWPERREMAGLMLEDKLCSRERERLADLRT